MIEEIHKACRIGDIETLSHLISKNQEYLNQNDSKLGWCPLYRSVVCNQLSSVEYLLKQGADANTQNRLGESPLHQASYNNYISIALSLLQHGASPNISQNDGDTPLHHACLRGHYEIVEILLKYNADPCKPNKVLCKTPVDYAVENGHTQIIQLLHHRKNKSCVVFNEDSSTTKETNFEPECEKTSRSRLDMQKISYSFTQELYSPLPHIPNNLLAWLSKYKLEVVYENLLQNGYEDLETLVSQIHGNPPLTLEQLEKIGICKPGHRLLLLARLEDELVKKPRISTSKSLNKITWCTKVPPSPGIEFSVGLEDFLDSLGLKVLLDRFIEAGLEDYEQVVFLMGSNYPITDEFLHKKVSIEKIGYRHRLLSRLNEEAVVKKKFLSIEKDDIRSACECIVI
ncbi:hypothetical protein SteCoe_27530 [Stentor coeruleus]|uniref:NAD(+) ADP-ribosyltransferase n=1 Tax=Stentor coeruleus TaxID=5963 RepID=A0A1R2BAD7_9CILI|nr:hypothetical protein SteCoe_27530 [Stentor coeruleus]